VPLLTKWESHREEDLPSASRLCIVHPPGCRCVEGGLALLRQVAGTILASKTTSTTSRLPPNQNLAKRLVLHILLKPCQYKWWDTAEYDMEDDI
jgi:hypothetical protein